MKGWRIDNGSVEVGVTERCGMLDPVRFTTPGGVVEPLHRAPWQGEEGAEVPMLEHLRGDFFCAPFGDSDVLDDERRPHGATANDRWALLRQSESDLVLELTKPVAGARVRKTVRLEAGHPVVYQLHELIGGSGRLPLGHHAMLHASEPLHLSFSPWRWGATPPEPVETAASGGRSLLAYPQRFSRLDEVRRADGGTVDLGVYPALARSEEIVMLVADAADNDRAFAWSAAVAPEAGWAWFGLKDPAVLPSTLLWLSNGGRDYAPWSGRHTRVIGIEEVTSYFHLGHRASAADNPLAAEGVATAVELRADEPVTVPYAFGLVAVPDGFARVSTVDAVEGGLQLSDGERTVFVPFDHDFFAREKTGAP